MENKELEIFRSMREPQIPVQTIFFLYKSRLADGPKAYSDILDNGLFKKSHSDMKLKTGYLLESATVLYISPVTVNKTDPNKGYQINVSFVVNLPSDPTKYFMSKRGGTISRVLMGFIVAEDKETTIYCDNATFPKVTCKVTAYDTNKHLAFVHLSMNGCPSPICVSGDKHALLLKSSSHTLVADFCVWEQNRDYQIKDAARCRKKEREETDLVREVPHDINQGFDYKFYLVTLRTADAAELPMVKRDDLARAMAIVYADQGGNEQITSSYKLMAEMQFAQEKYHIQGGEKPDTKFITLVKRYIREIEIYQEQLDGFPDWAHLLMKERYGIMI